LPMKSELMGYFRFSKIPDRRSVDSTMFVASTSMVPQAVTVSMLAHPELVLTQRHHIIRRCSACRKKALGVKWLGKRQAATILFRGGPEAARRRRTAGRRAGVRRRPSLIDCGGGIRLGRTGSLSLVRKGPSGARNGRRAVLSQRGTCG
jgi:hypothetical protein